MNFLFSLPLPAIAAAPLPAEAGGLATSTVLLGLLVVAVAWLALTVSNLRNEVASLKDALTVKPAAAPARPASVASEPVGPSAEEVAVIAAAVRCLLGASARVVAVVPPDANAQAWSREGRREVFQSHQIR